ncbi:PASTA domain-containing protein, partial [Streptomyces sp. NPDC000941]
GLLRVRGALSDADPSDAGRLADSLLGDLSRRAGLEVKITREFSDVVDKGEVIKTDPGGGKQIRNTGTVTIHVSDGPPRTQVPNVVGMPRKEAEQQISDANLSVGEVTETFSDETPQGVVLSTDPKAGTTRRPNTRVGIEVSRGPKIEIPDVIGESEDDARDELTEAGFTVEIASERVFSDEDKGSVADQSPVSGNGAVGAKGDKVTLTLSKGQEMIEVPDVTGLSEDDAKQTLEAAGFEVDVDKPLLFPGDTVTDQSVEGGDEAPKGSSITIKFKGVF